MVKLQNGCICCTLRQDLLEEIVRIANKGDFDALVVESTGASDPMEVAETFSFPIKQAEANRKGAAEENPQDQEHAGPIVDEIAPLDTTVTVVDSARFWQDFQSVNRLRHRDGDDKVDENEDKNVVELMIGQIEFADLVLLNKADLVAEDQLKQITSVIKAMNTNCEVLTSTRGKVGLDKVINTGKFSMDRARTAPGWLSSLHGAKVPETEEYGIKHFVYRARRPFNPCRFMDWASDNWIFTMHQAGDASSDGEGSEEEEGGEDEGGEDDEGGDDGEDDDKVGEEKEDAEQREQDRDEVLANCTKQFGKLLRAKGFVWFASRPEVSAAWNQVGCMAELANGGRWFASTPKSEWPEDPEELAELKKLFEKPHGDRRQELVFIGQSMKEEAIRKSLDECLLTDNEMDVYVKATRTKVLDIQALLSAFPEGIDVEGEKEGENPQECSVEPPKKKIKKQ